MTAETTWRGAFDAEEVNRLHAEAFGTRVFTTAEWDWVAQTAAHSAGWVVARDAGVLVGFLNVVSDGSAIPWRVRARSSSFSNLAVTHELCRGCLIADVPAVVGSLDIVMGEIDR